MEIFSGFKSYPASVRAPMPRTRYHPSSSPIALAACCLANAIRQHDHMLVFVSQGQATLQYHSLISRCVCSRSGACSRASKDTSHAPVATRIAHVPLLARVTDWARGAICSTTIHSDGGGTGRASTKWEKAAAAWMAAQRRIGRCATPPSNLELAALLTTSVHMLTCAPLPSQVARSCRLRLRLDGRCWQRRVRGRRRHHRRSAASRWLPR